MDQVPCRVKAMGLFINGITVFRGEHLTTCERQVTQEVFPSGGMCGVRLERGEMRYGQIRK